ncbi:GntR family transcriptional regulator [Micromonospora sp. C32]|nr:GntR family transcriptional regulator [Micromonospora sp. C72]MBQ1057038.1 GntR family transcriptional regulator [Micromonospora sp. C32]
MAIDPRSHTPVYVQLADLLRERIESGEMSAGSTLASEARLSQEYGIGRDAVRMAISLLRSEGLVSTRRGHGTVVRETPQRRQVELAAGARVVARMPYRCRAPEHAAGRGRTGARDPRPGGRRGVAAGRRGGADPPGARLSRAARVRRWAYPSPRRRP